MTTPFEDWKAELLHVGNIVQDGDKSVHPDERHRRFIRYIEMLEELTGSEGFDYALAIMQSLQAENDYGGYQAAGHAAWRFGEEAYCRALIHELPRLIRTIPDWAGDYLVSIANGQHTPYESTIHVFNRLLLDSDYDVKDCIDTYIRSEERPGGWLCNRVGVMGSNA